MTTDPPTMRAIIQHSYGAPRDVLRLGQVQRPSFGAEDVLIRVRATSVNTPDWATVAGVPAILRLGIGLRRPGHPVRGSDVAGVVEAVGSQVTDLRPGDEVFGSLWGSTARTRPGTFAEYAVAPGSQVVRKPAALSFADAAASVMTGLTALIAMRDVGQVGAGRRVLVNGASGGVGTMAVQIAASLGAEVTGVCGTGNVELVRSLGAARVIDYTSGGLHPRRAAVRRHPRQRTEPPARGDRAAARPGGRAHTEQHREHGRPAGRPAAGRAGDADGPWLHHREDGDAPR